MPELMSILTDPNIVYLILVFGLWFAVTAIYLPGSGVLESIAVVTLIAALMLFLSMPTNWIAVVAVVAGVLGFILIPFINFQYAPVAIGGLALQTAGTLFLFNGLTVSPILLVFALAMSLAYHRFVLTPVLERVQAQHSEPDKNERIIGMRGRVQKQLDPIGTVLVDSEVWSATSSEYLDSGTLVVVVAREGLQLIVEPLKRKDESVTEQNLTAE